MNSLKLAFALLLMLAWSVGEARERAPTTRTGTSASTKFCNPPSGSTTNPLPGNMCFQLNIAYGSDPLQKLDVYMPAAGAYKAPVVLMVHGGGWYQGDKMDSSVVWNKAVNWVPTGAVFISINYPLVPKSDPVQQARSVAQALAYAQQHATEWGGDPAKFILMGFSAGGHLVSLVASDPSLAQSNGLRVQPWLGTIALDAAVYDVPMTMNNPKHDPIFDQAFGTSTSYWTAASPMAKLARRTPPFLAVCSTLESGSCSRAQAFVDKALGYGSDALVQSVALDHEHVNANLGLASDYTNQVNAFMTGLINGSLR
jgi:acetyl esterase/lipase